MKRRMRSPFLVAALLLAAASTASAQAKIFWPTPECEKLCARLAQDQAPDKDKPPKYLAEWDDTVFWKRLGLDSHEVTSRVLLLEAYFFSLDGRVSLLRTGSEVKLYQLIKEFVRTRKSPTEVLGPEDIFFRAMLAVKDERGRSNIQLAMLTAHNVMRILARPQVWDENMRPQHPYDAAVVPIMKDLGGTESVDGKDTLTLRDFLGLTVSPDPMPDVPNEWLWFLFMPDEVTPTAERPSGRKRPRNLPQIFRSLPGTLDPTNSRESFQAVNGGAQYYFWIGALGYAVIGETATRVMLAGELLLKEAEVALGQSGNSNARGAIQAASGKRGIDLSKCLELRVTEVKAAVEPALGPADDRTFRLELRVTTDSKNEPPSYTVVSVIDPGGLRPSVNLPLKEATSNDPAFRIWETSQRVQGLGPNLWKFRVHTSDDIDGQVPFGVTDEWTWSGEWQVDLFLPSRDGKKDRTEPLGKMTLRRVSAEEFRKEIEKPEISGRFPFFKPDCYRFPTPDTVYYLGDCTWDSFSAEEKIFPKLRTGYQPRGCTIQACSNQSGRLEGSYADKKTPFAGNFTLTAGSTTPRQFSGPVHILYSKISDIWLANEGRDIEWRGRSLDSPSGH